jgi:hypothetical protein
MLRLCAALFLFHKVLLYIADVPGDGTVGKAQGIMFALQRVFLMVMALHWCGRAPVPTARYAAVALLTGLTFSLLNLVPEFQSSLNNAGTVSTIVYVCVFAVVGIALLYDLYHTYAPRPLLIVAFYVIWGLITLGESPSLHIHHYILGFLGACLFERLSLMHALCLGTFIQGLAVYSVPLYPFL